MGKFWTNYGAHALGYLLASLPVLQSLAPALIPGYGAAIAAAAGGLLLVVHNVQAASANGATPPAASAAKALPLLFALALTATFAAGSLQGCSTIAKLASPTAAPYVTAAADVAVATAVSKGVSAVQIKAIAQAALAADTGATVTLTSVESVVNAEIVKLKLPPGDVAAAQILLAALTQAAQAEIASAQSKVPATTQAAVADVLNQVIAACAAYGA